MQRGVEQADAWSCSLFLFCMDPLIGNLRGNKKIEPLQFKSRKTNTLVQHKASGYADDVATVCKNNLQSVQGVFREYERSTKKSGLEPNAVKTERSRIGHLNDEEMNIPVNYREKVYTVKTVDQMKIWGLYFCKMA